MGPDIKKKLPGFPFLSESQWFILTYITPLQLIETSSVFVSLFSSQVTVYSLCNHCVEINFVPHFPNFACMFTYIQCVIFPWKWQLCCLQFTEINSSEWSRNHQILSFWLVDRWPVIVLAAFCQGLTILIFLHHKFKTNSFISIIVMLQNRNKLHLSDYYWWINSLDSKFNDRMDSAMHCLLFRQIWSLDCLFTKNSPPNSIYLLSTPLFCTQYIWAQFWAVYVLQIFWI